MPRTDHFLRSRFLATGGSAIKAVEVLIDHGVPQERIIFLNLVSCPEGLRAMYSAYPQVKVVTAWVDDGLDAHKYIVPGLGGEFTVYILRRCSFPGKEEGFRGLIDTPPPDFGDRYFTSN